SDIIAKEASLGFIEGEEGKEDLKDKVMSALKESFRPEFLNRIDDIIIFNYLGKAEIKKIVDLQLNNIAGRFSQKGIGIKVSEKAKEFLAERGFDQNLGARPLKRVLQKRILDPLALKIVSGEIKARDNILVDLQDNNIVFRTAKDLIKGNFKRDKVLIR
ncbi:MAG: type VI secretion system ATPase TssH, partial [Candidatus Nealsonbacteria bacterium]|nr:type VI secretion system ATPase TssH [Candidatus Nealsonbacteria bacterium]